MYIRLSHMYVHCTYRPIFICLWTVDEFVCKIQWGVTIDSTLKFKFFRIKKYT